jgi:hypothetical protein
MTAPEITPPAGDAPSTGAVDLSTPTPTPPDDASPSAPVDPSTPPPADDADSLDGTRKLRQENRGLRDRSRTAETDLTAARAELDVLRREAVDRIVVGELRDVRDFTDRHPDPAEFIGDDGQLDTAAVLAAAQALATERPHYAAPPVITAPPSVTPVERLRPGASRWPAESLPEPNWDTVLRRGMDQPAGYGD